MFSAWFVSLGSRLLLTSRRSPRLRHAAQLQLFQDVAGLAKLFCHEKHVANVDRDGSALCVVVEKVITESFVVAVEDYSDLFAASVHDGTAGVAADDIGIGEEIDGHIGSVGSSVW